jgi:4-aminobutyrate aminotransferase / (S)-3-amino-2-methylpropionate transaminase
MASLLRAASRARPAAVRSFGLRRQYASAAASAAVFEKGEQSFFPDEPAAPIVQTAIPGPKSTAAIERLSKVFDTRSLNMMANYEKSYGN